MSKTVLIMGGTGYLGSHLVTHLSYHGYRIIVQTRNQAFRMNTSKVTYISHFAEIEEKVDVVVHLAGVPLSEHRWNKAFRQDIVDSRVIPLNKLRSWLSSVSEENRPPLLIAASSYGYYGMGTRRPAHMYDEDGPAGKDHFAEMFIKIEHEAMKMQDFFEKVVIIRTANVLGLGGHVFKQITTPIQMGFSGVYGTGDQSFPWIHQQDWVSAVNFLIDHDGGDYSVYNLASPSMNQQYEFAGLCSSFIGKESDRPLPTVVLRSMLGERADTLMNGNYIEPRNLLRQNFRFRFKDLYEAMDYIY